MLKTSHGKRGSALQSGLRSSHCPCGAAQVPLPQQRSCALPRKLQECNVDFSGSIQPPKRGSTEGATSTKCARTRNDTRRVPIRMGRYVCTKVHLVIDVLVCDYLSFLLFSYFSNLSNAISKNASSSIEPYRSYMGRCIGC